jgi:peptidase E
MSEQTFALMGSGEFDPWSEAVDRWVLDRAQSDGPILILPTASAPEGDDVFEGWADKGRRHFAEAGIAAEVLPLKTRDDASRVDLMARLEDACAVYFSGGNPWYLAETLRSSPFLEAMTDAMDRGLAYVGCSAGVACLTEMTFDAATDDFEQVFKPGLGLVKRILFGPHWDIVDTWIPGATELIVGSVRDGDTFVGIDETTAMLGDGRSWTVTGTAGVHVRREGEWTHHHDGDVFELIFSGFEAETEPA